MKKRQLKIARKLSSNNKTNRLKQILMRKRQIAERRRLAFTMSQIV